MGRRGRAWHRDATRAMSERTRDERREAPEVSEAAGGACSSSRTTGSEKPSQENSAQESPAEREERNDLIIEGWQAPKPDRMKGDGREIWQFESEKGKPSGALWFNLVAVILALAGGLALIIYGVLRLASAIDRSGPEFP